jgi:hypothetical protein
VIDLGKELGGLTMNNLPIVDNSQVLYRRVQASLCAPSAMCGGVGSYLALVNTQTGLCDPPHFRK